MELVVDWDKAWSDEPEAAYVAFDFAAANGTLDLETAVDAVGPVRNGGPGRPRRRPKKLHGDKAYDHKRCRKALKARRIEPRIARRGVESSERLGRHRWVVERTLAWLGQFRRLRVRYERRAELHLAFTLLACALICFSKLTAAKK